MGSGAVQVLAQLAGVVGRVADEVFQRRAEAAGITVQPVGEELQHLRQLGCVIGVQGYCGHGIAASAVPRVLTAGLVIVVSCFRRP